MVIIDSNIIIQTISNFEIEEKYTTENIDDILKKYPAFGTLHLINAVVLNKKNPQLFSKKLAKIATTVKDRTLLHDYVHQDVFSYNQAIQEKQIEVAVESSTPEIVENIKLEKETVIDISVEKIETPKEIIVEEIIAKEVIEVKEIENFFVENKLAITPKEIVDEVTKSIEKIELKNNVSESIETKEEKSIPDKRNKALDSLSNELFGSKIEEITAKTSEKDRKRIEAMKKLQEELFQTKRPSKKSKSKIIQKEYKPIESKPVEKKEPLEVKNNDKKSISKEIINKIASTKYIKKEEQKELISSKKVVEKISKPNIEKTKEEFKEKISFADKVEALKKIANSKSEQAKPTENKQKTNSNNKLLEKLKHQSTSHVKQITKPVESKKEIKNPYSKNNHFATDEKSISIQEKIELLKAKLKLDKVSLEKNILKAVSIKEISKPIIKEEIVVESIKVIAPKVKELVPKKEIVEIKKEIKKEVKKAVTPKSIEKPDTSNPLEFLKWLKNKKSISNETANREPVEKEIVKKHIPKATITKEETKKETIQIKRNDEDFSKKKMTIPKLTSIQKEDVVPFDRASTIEAEMHKEIKKSEDPLDSFISVQIRKKKSIKKNTTSENIKKTRGMVTETLAEIMVVQQNYSEAIEIYTTLSIKYPQKSIYFATQIEKIKTYL